MAEEKEILRYELDTAQAKAKADELSRALDGVGKAAAGDTAKNVGQTAQAFEAVGVAAKGSGHVIEDFDRKGEKLAKSVAGAINPAFARQISFLFDINDGLSKVTASMLGLAAAGIGVGAVALVFQKIQEEIAKTEQKAREVEERVKANRATRDKSEMSVLDRLREAGVSAGAEPSVSAMIDQLTSGENKPFPMQREFATEAAIAAARGMNPEDAAALGAGLMASGKSSVDYRGGERAAQYIKRGRHGKAMEMFSQDQRARAGQIAAGRTPPREPTQAEFEAKAIDDYIARQKLIDPTFDSDAEQSVRRAFRDRRGTSWEERAEFASQNRTFGQVFYELYDELNRVMRGEEPGGEKYLQRRRLERNTLQGVANERASWPGRFAAEQVKETQQPTVIIIGTQLNTGNPNARPTFNSGANAPGATNVGRN